MAPDSNTTVSQDRAIAALEAIEAADQLSADALEQARVAVDLLNREHPAREVALSVTALEDSRARLAVALWAMHGRPVPRPGVEYARVDRTEHDGLYLVFHDGTGLFIKGSGSEREVTSFIGDPRQFVPGSDGPPTVSGGGYDGPREGPEWKAPA